MSKPHIRKCTPGDIDEVCRMQTEWAEENITYGFVPSSREVLINRLGPYFFVADVEGRIVGFVYGTVHVSEGLAVIPAGQQHLEIDDIYVEPEFRGRRIGGMLLDRLVQAAEQNGVRRFLVYSATKDMDEILRFYRGHGFKPWYVQMFK